MLLLKSKNLSTGFSNRRKHSVPSVGAELGVCLTSILSLDGSWYPLPQRGARGLLLFYSMARWMWMETSFQVITEKSQGLLLQEGGEKKPISLPRFFSTGIGQNFSGAFPLLGALLENTC